MAIPRRGRTRRPLQPPVAPEPPCRGSRDPSEPENPEIRKPERTVLRRVLLLVPLALGGCGDLLQPSDRIPTTLEVSDFGVLATEGDEVALDVTVFDQYGEPFGAIPGWAGPIWDFPASIVAEENGGLLAVGPGEANGTVRVGELSRPARVRVNPRSLALDFAAVYATQPVQTPEGDVPLVAGREALLRVFLRGDQRSFFQPQVRVGIYQGTRLMETLTLEPGGDSIPLRLREGDLRNSWNVTLPADYIRPGLGVVVEADPAGVVPLSTGARTRFPEAGIHALAVVEVPKLWLRLVPIRQIGPGTTGRIDEGNLETFIEPLLAMFPITEYDVDIAEPFETSSSSATMDGWTDILYELDALRVAEGSGRYYYGVLQASPSTPYAGLGFVGYPAAIGYDQLPRAAETLAHELGHNFGRPHSPCGGAAGVDPSYPYADGSIGMFGYDAARGVVKDPATQRDVMSYCAPRWASDFTYRRVLDFRLSGDNGTGETGAASDARPSLLVWGGIRGGEAVLEPAFELTTRPALPAEAGPYTVEGLDANGAVVFSIAFAPRSVADGSSDARSFAFAIPVEQAQPDRLARLRLRGPGIDVERGRAAAAGKVAAAKFSARAEGRGLRLRWSAAERPAALVRDARTGRIISFARGGDVELAAGASEVEVLLSDGVRTERGSVRVR